MILYNNIEIKNVLKNKRVLTKWIKECILEEDKKLNYIFFNFCTDIYILELNKAALGHDYYTDIITFELNEKNEAIEGDIYISLDRIKENAIVLNELFITELHRVMIHGVLHLCGYKDKTKKNSQLMREKENYYLKKL